MRSFFILGFLLIPFALIHSPSVDAGKIATGEEFDVPKKHEFKHEEIEEAIKSVRAEYEKAKGKNAGNETVINRVIRELKEKKLHKLNEVREQHGKPLERSGSGLHYDALTKLLLSPKYSKQLEEIAELKNPESTKTYPKSGDKDKAAHQRRLLLRKSKSRLSATSFDRNFENSEGSSAGMAGKLYGSERSISPSSNRSQDGKKKGSVSQLKVEIPLNDSWKAFGNRTDKSLHTGRNSAKSPRSDDGSQRGGGGGGSSAGGSRQASPKISPRINPHVSPKTSPTSQGSQSEKKTKTPSEGSPRTPKTLETPSVKTPKSPSKGGNSTANKQILDGNTDEEDERVNAELKEKEDPQTQLDDMNVLLVEAAKKQAQEALAGKKILTTNGDIPVQVDAVEQSSMIGETDQQNMLQRFSEHNLDQILDPNMSDGQQQQPPMGITEANGGEFANESSNSVGEGHSSQPQSPGQRRQSDGRVVIVGTHYNGSYAETQKNQYNKIHVNDAAKSKIDNIVPEELSTNSVQEQQSNALEEDSATGAGNALSPHGIHGNGTGSPGHGFPPPSPRGTDDFPPPVERENIEENIQMGQMESPNSGTPLASPPAFNGTPLEVSEIPQSQNDLAGNEQINEMSPDVGEVGQIGVNTMPGSPVGSPLPSPNAQQNAIKHLHLHGTSPNGSPGMSTNDFSSNMPPSALQLPETNLRSDAIRSPHPISSPTGSATSHLDPQALDISSSISPRGGVLQTIGNGSSQPNSPTANKTLPDLTSPKGEHTFQGTGSPVRIHANGSTSFGMENKEDKAEEPHEGGGVEGRNLPGSAPSSPVNHGGQQKGHIHDLPMPVPTIVEHGENPPLLESANSVGEMMPMLTHGSETGMDSGDGNPDPE